MIIRVKRLLLPAAGLFALGSCAIQRHGPDHAIYCSLGKSQDGFDIYCPKPVLNGGWPAPFAFDRPGISVEGKVSFPEDDFRPWPFIANIGFYYFVLLALHRSLQLLRRR